MRGHTTMSTHPPLIIIISSLLHKMGGKFCRTIFPNPYNDFASDLISVIVDKESSQNVVYSPASIHACLTLICVGAEEEEMHRVLKLPYENKKEVLQGYKIFFQLKPELKMAIRLYVKNKVKVTSQFNKIAQDFFDTKAESVDFRKKQEVVENINHWVEQQSESKIKNFLQTDAVNDDTTAILVNCTYFKSLWLRPFNKECTMKAPFYMDNNQQTEVDMMYTKDSFGYVELPELRATALAMPYKYSNISMLIILPNDRDGFKPLQKQLITFDFYQFVSMTSKEVSVFLPKFCVEYKIDLKEHLKQMGSNSMFDETANFSGLFKNARHKKISDVKHTAFLDVNEVGSCVAAATTQTFFHLCSKSGEIEFRADHAFVFAIFDEYTVYIAGHVAKF